MKEFKPQHGGGGSKKGKPQGDWPWIIKVVADAVVLSVKGTMDSWVQDRQFPMTMTEFEWRMDTMLPGWQKHAPPAMTAPIERLKNRVYKMYYSGTSDRGSRHDPKTRACQSGEHWFKHVPVGHPLRDIHDRVFRKKVSTVRGWKSYLLFDEELRSTSASQPVLPL